VSTPEVAEELYREAIERLARTRIRTELARAHLNYGEWLRHEHRRAEAREQLGRARELFVAAGAHAFAARAARELQPAGKHTAAEDLTPREAQIAQLARDGLSNAQIGAQMYISPRTVEYHLTKIFAKLDLSSRNELRLALPARRDRSLAAAE
jgi:DNA-binding CsgD family transcriptional regulator